LSLIDIGFERDGVIQYPEQEVGNEISEGVSSSQL
jgi:hypothetical protein